MPTPFKRQRTPAQLANDQRMRERAAATKAANQAAATPDEASASLTLDAIQHDASPVGPVAQADPEDNAGAGALLAEIARIATEASGRGAAARQSVTKIEDLLGKIDPRSPEALALAESPVIQAFLDQMAERMSRDPNLAPGSLVGVGMAQQKKHWQFKDVHDRMMEWYATGKGNPDFKPVEFLPNETMPLTWNGIGITVEADREAIVPKCYHDIYQERRRALRSAEQHAAHLFKARDGVAFNDPLVDPSIIDNDGTRRVRGSGRGPIPGMPGLYQPGGGGFDVGEEATEGVA